MIYHYLIQNFIKLYPTLYFVYLYAPYIGYHELSVIYNNNVMFSYFGGKACFLNKYLKKKLG